MSKRGVRAAAFLEKAALFIDDAAEEQCFQRPFQDGTYQGHITFDSLSARGNAVFTREFFSDKARTQLVDTARWEEKPTDLFRRLKREMQWDASGVQKFEQLGPQYAALAHLLPGAQLPSGWVKAAQAIAAAPRLKR